MASFQALIDRLGAHELAMRESLDKQQDRVCRKLDETNAKVDATNAKVAELDNSITEHQAKASEREKAEAEFHDAIKKTIWGNGKPGLTTTALDNANRIQILEKWQTSIFWVCGSIGTPCLLYVIYVLIQALAKKMGLL